ncbi:MAG: hypothetical protein JRJ35_06510 [Deltaproteobacteria bacterium]|nr:hypothetical protein [Deltaproteobacteria bacterium]MBW2009287.1 hypothetical protein [Deltaproteobacteria bacterium]
MTIMTRRMNRPKFRVARMRRVGPVGFVLLLSASLVLISGVPAALAHRVNVFAWVQGKRVHVQAAFSGGKKVRNGTVRVYDSKGALVTEGTTNVKGEFSFGLRHKEPLRVVVLAGAGHRGEWTLSREELSEEPETPASHSPGGASTDTSPVPGKSSPEAVLSREELRLAVEKALDRKLKPFYTLLADSLNRRPSVPEILGGIGYIIGLVGLATYLRYRKEGKEARPE